MITTQPTSLTVIAGQPASFSVIATGAPPLSYQWFFEGAVIVSATNSAFTRASAQTNHSGIYFVTVSNLYGVAVSSNALLTAIEPVCVATPTGAVAWWRAESNCFDAIGINDGLPNTTPASLFSTGKVGTAFSFSTSTYHVRVPAAPELDVGPGAGLALEAWIRPTTLGANPIAEWNDGRGNPGVSIGLTLSSGLYRLMVNFRDTQSVSHVVLASGSVVSNLLWQHVAATYDKTSGAAALYLNGAQVAQTNLGTLTLLTRTNFYIGFSPAVSGGTTWRGNIDELTLYNHSLTPEEIQAIYAADRAGKCAAPPACAPIPSGLVSWWQAQSNAFDRVGLNHGLPPTSPASSFGAGLVGVAFRPAANFVRVPASPSLDVGAGAGFSFETWINAANLNSVQPIAEWNNGTGLIGVLGVNLVAFPAPGTTSLQADLMDTNGVSHILRAPWGVVTNGVWQHIALSYDKAAGTGTLYVNGLVITQANLGTFTPRTSTNFYLGYRSAGSSAGRTFSGSLDEPSLYSRALTAEEIRAIHHAHEVGKCPVVFPPAIRQQPVGAIADVGEGATFAATFSGTPPLRYQWFHGSDPVTGGTNSSLVFTNVQFADAGMYSLRATNEAGFAVSSDISLTVPVPGPCLPPPPGLVAWWRGEGDGAELISGFDAGLSNAVQFSSGKVNGGFRFNGSAYGFVPRRSFLNLGAGDGMTIECWVWPTNTASRQGLVEWSDNGLSLRISENSAGSVYANLGIYNQSAYPLSSAAGLLRTNGWNHIGLTFEKAGGRLRLWLNGAIVAESTKPVLPATGGDVFLGGSPYKLQGALDEISLYSRALTEAEMQALFNVRTAGKCAVPQPPRFVMQPLSRIVAPGEFVSFSVETLGPTPIAYQWLFNGTAIPDATNTSFALPAVETTNEGTYSVRATNFAGASFSSGATLNVTAINFSVLPPEFRDQAGYSGGNLAGSPERKQQFYGASLFPAGPLLIHELRYRPIGFGGAFTSTVPKIEFRLSTTPLTAGDLTTHFADNAGSDETVVFSGALPLSSRFLILSNGTPEFDIVVPLQTAFVFDPTAGNLLVEVRNEFSAAMGYVDTINPSAVLQEVWSANPAAADATRIGCCSQILGVAWRPALVPPQILAQPAPVTNFVGEAAGFSVRAKGTPLLRYQWLHDGAPMTGETAASLTIPYPQFTDAGNYSVIVSNEFGAVTSSNALLVVHPAPSCVAPPIGLVAWWPFDGGLNDVAGGNALTTINVPIFVQSKVVQGLRFTTNGPRLDLPSSQLLDVGAGQGLTIEFWLNPDDKWPYMSLLNWSALPDHYGVAIHLNVPTQAGGGPGAIYVNLIDINGGWHYFSTIPGVVKPNLFQHLAITYDKATGVARFYRNGVLVQSATLGNFRPETRLPVFIGRQMDNSWMFQGVLDEMSFYNRALSEVEVQGLFAAQVSGKCRTGAPPVVLLHPLDLTVESGETARFMVAATGEQPLHYQWQFNGTPISEAISNSLMISAANLGDAGSYAVSVSNIAGVTFSSNAILTVFPSVPVPVIQTVAPESGPVGSLVAISGANFAPTPEDNVVFFGAVRASVVSAASNSLIVVVPPGVTYAPLTVTARQRTARSPAPFRQTFDSARIITSGSFAPRFNLAAGGWTLHPATGDLDGDGRPDIIVPNEGSDTLAVIQNHSLPGSLSPDSFLPRIDLACPEPFSAMLADIDSDGRLDLMVASLNGRAVCLYHNLSTGGLLTTNSFGARVDLPTGGPCLQVAAGDLDGDGRLDILAARTDGNVSVFRNLGNGGEITTNTFAARVDLSIAANSIAVGDVDGDGPLDLVVGGGSVTIARNRSVGYGLTQNSFEPAVSFPGDGYAVALGDLDLDGRSDVATASWYGQMLSVFRNVSTPGLVTAASLQPKVDWSITGQAEKLAIGEIDGDGRPEIVVISALNSRLAVFQNQTAPGSIVSNSFGPKVELLTGASPDYANGADGVVIADFDLDGRPDLLFPNAWDGLVSIYRNVIPSQTPPAITVQPQSQSVREDGTAILFVGATGTLPLRYQWFLNGNELVGATNAVLVLPNIQPGQAGSYEIVLSNALGTLTSSNATLVVSPVNCAPTPSRVAAWWRAEDNGLDGIGTNHGTLEGAAAYAPGRVGRAFQFAAAADTVVTSASSATLPAGPFTVEGWVYLAVPVGASGAMIAAQGSALLAPNWSLGVSAAGKLQPQLSVGGTSVRFEAFTPLAVGNWHHVAMVFSGSNLLAYVNGVFDGARNISGLPATSGEPLRLGGFVGRLDEFTFYQGALSVTEIETIFAAGSHGKCPLSPPLATSLSVKNLTSTNAVLRALVDGGLAGLTAWFEWGTNASYGAGTPPRFLPASGTNLYIADTISGLMPGRTYHYRVGVTNAWGSNTGADLRFQWQPSSPTLAAMLLGPDTALRLAFTGAPGYGYLVLTSTNLVQWESAGMAVEKAAGQFEYLADLYPQSPARFYRLLSP